MPALAPLHPQIVHFVIALLFCGVLFRWLSLIGTGRLAFTGPAAAVLLLVGTAAAVLAVQSGPAAHGPVERVPGARAAVQDHEEWGERTRNIFLGVALLEDAAQLVGELAQRYPDDTAVRLLTVESLIVDKHDGRGALAALKWFPPAPESRFLRFRVGLLRADALAAAGMLDSAKILLQGMAV